MGSKKFNAAVKKYIKLIEEGNSVEAIEKYYNKDIVQIENTDKPITGKEKLKLMEIDNLEHIISVENKINNLLIDDKKQKTWDEMKIVFNSKKYGLKSLTEGFYQEWNSKNEITLQKFYFKGLDDYFPE